MGSIPEREKRKKREIIWRNNETLLSLKKELITKWLVDRILKVLSAK